ncbi:MAG: hypothetical protein L0Y57_11665 [Beijerinckiaceae bacterium]|nr:hypothetical protein [Beijerinckiaceae bacterium]
MRLEKTPVIVLAALLAIPLGFAAPAAAAPVMLKSPAAHEASGMIHGASSHSPAGTKSKTSHSHRHRHCHHHSHPHHEHHHGK